MKRFLLILVLAAVSLNLSGSVRPFNTKIVKDTEFTLAVDANVEKTGYRPMFVFFLKKGVNVTVLGRSAVDPGRFHVKLGDGSKGWVPAEAFCDKTEVTVSTPKGKRTYQLGKDTCQKHFSGTRDSASNEYSLLNQAIVNTCLPEAYKYLALHAGHGSTVCKIKGGIQSLYGNYMYPVNEVLGFEYEEIESSFGEKEGRHLVYYADILTGKADDDHVYTGLYVVYDKDYRAVGVFAPGDYSRPAKGLVVTEMTPPTPPTTEGILRGVRPEYASMVFTDTEIKGSGWKDGPPRILTKEDREGYVVTDDPFGDNLEEGEPMLEKEQRQQLEREQRTKFLRENPTFFRNKYGHDTFKWALLHILIFLLAYVLIDQALEHRWFGYNFNVYWWIFLVLMLVTFPYPQDLFSNFFHWGLWGGCEIAIGLFLAFIFWENFVSMGKNMGFHGYAWCWGCYRWVEPRWGKSRITQYDCDKPKKDPRDMHVMVKKLPPHCFDKTEVDGQGKSYKETTSIHLVASVMKVHATRLTQCSCPRCGRKWTDSEIVTEEVRGPIIREQRMERIESFIEKTKKFNPITGEEEEIDSRDVTNTENFVEFRHSDFDNYNPYFKRYLAGDEDALGEYYTKYWPE